MSFPAWTADSALTTHSLSGQKSFSTVHSVNMVHGVAVTVTNISATSNGLSMSSTDANSPIAMPESSARSRSEEHTSELQSLMRISYAVFCLKKKKIVIKNHYTGIHLRSQFI